MKVICHATTRPVGRKLPQDVTIELDVPFTPFLGCSLMLPGFGAYMRVDDVFWSFEEPGVVRVYFDEDATNDADLPEFKDAVTAGWKKA